MSEASLLTAPFRLFETALGHDSGQIASNRPEIAPRIVRCGSAQRRDVGLGPPTANRQPSGRPSCSRSCRHSDDPSIWPATRLRHPNLHLESAGVGLQKATTRAVASARPIVQAKATDSGVERVIHGQDRRGFGDEVTRNARSAPRNSQAPSRWLRGSDEPALEIAGPVWPASWQKLGFHGCAERQWRRQPIVDVALRLLADPTGTSRHRKSFCITLELTAWNCPRYESRRRRRRSSGKMRSW